MTTKCLESVVSGKQGILCVGYFPSKNLLFVSDKFYGAPKTITELSYVWPPSLSGMLPDIKHSDFVIHHLLFRVIVIIFIIQRSGEQYSISRHMHHPFHHTTYVLISLFM